jgi:hypothetical protein
VRYLKAILLFLFLPVIAFSQKDDYYSDTLSSNISQYSEKNNSIELILPMQNAFGLRYRNYKAKWTKEVYFHLNEEHHQLDRQQHYMNDSAVFSFAPASMTNLISLEGGLGKMKEYWGWSSRLSVSYLKKEDSYSYDFLRYARDPMTNQYYFETKNNGGSDNLNYLTLERYYMSLDFIRVGINTGIEAHVNVQRFLISLGTDLFIGNEILLKQRRNDPYDFLDLSNQNSFVINQYIRFGLGYSF